MKKKKEVENYKRPHTYSCEDDIVDLFEVLCSNNNSTASREIRGFILEYIKRHRDDENKEVVSNYVKKYKKESK